MLTHHPPDWVVSFLSVKPCLVHCTSLFSNEWENACLLLTENAWVPFSHPTIHHSVGKDTCYPFLFISYWKDISSFDQGHIFLYLFQYLVMVKQHIFNHKYSPWIKQWVDWLWGQPLLSPRKASPSLPVIRLMLCLQSSTRIFPNLLLAWKSLLLQQTKISSPGAWILCKRVTDHCSLPHICQELIHTGNSSFLPTVVKIYLSSYIQESMTQTSLGVYPGHSIKEFCQITFFSLSEHDAIIISVAGFTNFSSTV